MSVPKRGHSIASIEKLLRPIATSLLKTTQITWMPDNAGQTHLQTKETELNPIHGGLLETLVHESFHHLVTPHRTPFFSMDVHELFIEAVEDKLVRHINRTPSAQAFWYPKCLSLMEPK